MDHSLDILSSLLQQVRALGASAADAVMLGSVEISASRRMGKPEGLERSENQAIGLRAFCGARQAIVSGTDTGREALTELAERAVAMAKAAPADPDSRLAPASLLSEHMPQLDLFDGNEPDVHWLDDQCRVAEEAALAVPGITNSEGADAGYSRGTTALAISDGNGISFAKTYAGSHFSVSVSVLAGTGTSMERDYDYASVRHRSDLTDASAIGESAAARALKRLNPRKVPSGRVPVVFEPRISRSLLSSFASAISGSAVSRRASFLKEAMGQDIFPAHVAIVDDPHIVRGMGSKPFDAEGVRNGRRALVEKGNLKSWLLDMRTASKLGLMTTGHASRGISSPPSPGSTNLYMENGTKTPQALMKDIKSGLYVTETFGMGINIVTGDYSQGASGFWIENGEIAYPVSEITIAGHLKDMFAGLTPANDLEFRYGTNAPTVRIEQMTVAGL